MTENLALRIRARVPEISGLAFLTAITALAFLLVQYRHAIDWVRHTVDVETSIASVFEMVQEAESNTRGYLLRGDDGYLKLFQVSADTIEPALAQLQKLTSDNADQQTVVEKLKPLIHRRFERFKVVIALYKTSGLAAALSTFTASGSAASEAVTQLITEMKTAESRLFTARVAEVQRTTVAVGLAALCALAVSVASLIAWIWATRRAIIELARAQVEREHKDAQIRQMQKIEAVGQLTGGLAHDLNNMLAVIISGLNLVQKRLAVGDAKVDRFVSAAMDGATRAATLTTRLMAFSRQLPLAPEAIDPNKLVGGISELIQRTLGETILTQTVLGAGIWRTSADAGELENAILNLSINARDAMPAGGTLTIETTNSQFDAQYAIENHMPEGSYVLIAVTDTGSGMSADVISKAFDPFFTTKGVGKGTGLGLSQVYGFIKQSGGHIKIYSELGHGTTIKMYLPRLLEVGPEQVIRTAREEAWPQMLPETRAENGRHLILVVEDDARVSEMTVSSLRELGYSVIHANGATAALERLDANPGTQLLFTDIVMPDINGRQLAAEALKRQPDLKVLYTTGFTRNAIVHSGRLDAGLNFIAKPFTLVQLAAKLSGIFVQPAPKPI